MTKSLPASGCEVNVHFTACREVESANFTSARQRTPPVFSIVQRIRNLSNERANCFV